METACEPKHFEQKWYEFWVEKKLFEGKPGSSKPPFSMVIPPPNVTGELHIGHALNNTLQDILVRWRRMRGFDAVWIPGTDHAGIATQMVVERRLAEEGRSRIDLGRDRFVEEVWKWRQQYGGRIIEQLKRLGVSCDWSRERFTLDPGLSRAVREVFIRLYREGLIYRGEYIVNWCPRCRTAISDLEVNHQEIAGKLYTIQYPLDSGDAHLLIATTRPETLLGDTAVAVHPDDPRYRKLVGRKARLPVLGRELPIIADPFVDPKFGTGAVKVTPAHDPNDFQAGRRHGLPVVIIMDDQGRMNEAAGPYAGLDRFQARKQIVEQLRHDGLLRKIEDHPHAVGHCQRCKTMVEPSLSPQWFLRIGPLAGPAIEAVEQGNIRFYPDSWKKTYFEWMRNIHDWCISRQLWWGHRIPAWHCSTGGHVVVADKEPKRCPECRGELRQDEDVLDTWFSSALWPFSTLGWPKESRDLKRYYPTSGLVTGYDIIFFWVARMIMMALKFQGAVPFHEVYFNGLVRDHHGEKMSKTRGNVIDPLDVIDQYGADAVRFTLAIMAVPGTEIPLSPERMAGYRTFVNKIWNAARFVMMNLGSEKPSPPPPLKRLGLAERWILSRVNRVALQVHEALEQYRFDEAANLLYHLTWHEYCDWYVELSKLHLSGDHADGEGRDRVLSVLVEVLDRLLRLLHPFMPFITEELWQKLPHGGVSVSVDAYPEFVGAEVDEQAEAQMEFLLEVITKVRNIRAESKIDPSRRIRVLLKVDGKLRRKLLEQQERAILRLTRTERVQFVEEFDKGLVAARGVLEGLEIAIPLAGLLDMEAERKRLGREKDKVERELETTSRKLNNDAFLNNAPDAVIAKVRKEHQQLLEKRARLEKTLDQLNS
jgi:valyl-tRNA synthetase